MAIQRQPGYIHKCDRHGCTCEIFHETEKLQPGWMEMSLNQILLDGRIEKRDRVFCKACIDRLSDILRDADFAF